MGTGMDDIVAHGTGNVFRDLGFEDADERLARADAFIAAEAAVDADPNRMALALLRRAMSGDGRVGLVGGGSLPYDGIQTVRIGHWRIELWMDAGSLDYVHGIEAPDGRRWKYDSVGQALSALSPKEAEAANAWLRTVEPWH